LQLIQKYRNSGVLGTFSKKYTCNIWIIGEPKMAKTAFKKIGSLKTLFYWPKLENYITVIIN